MDRDEHSLKQHSTPPGLDALYKQCSGLYPDQTNPLQVIAVKKYWLGGPDPLDYVSMYNNPGCPENNISPHWHYISFGLSDLHGDGRIHEAGDPSTASGFGFELTFRVKKEEDETSPPTWPAALMQGLARYVFKTGKVFMVGDHVPWKCPLDNSESRIQHIILTEDPQLKRVNTCLGFVQFIQIVGVTSEELEAARHWNPAGVIRIMKRLPGMGGEWLTTDMRRGETIFEMDCTVREEVDTGIEKEGSDLTGVNAILHWEEVNPGNYSSDEDQTPRLTEYQSQQIKLELQKGLMNSEKSSCNSLREYCDSSSGSDTGFLELVAPKKLEAVHISLNYEAASLFPLIIRGRLRHGRHFTFLSVCGRRFLTLVVPSVTGTFTNEERPLTAQGDWLQIRLEEEQMLDILNNTCDLNPKLLPVRREIKKNICLTVTPDS